MFKVSSPATDTLPVGYLFNHLFCSNVRNKARGQPPSQKGDGAIPRRLD
jgi:hypothetical protein